ncbi:MAG: hypothetical protein OXF22_06300 [Anaerolineaceae bacterium]|nr:hypothetical protein [Anaerolineaceae bacterium]
MHGDETREKAERYIWLAEVLEKHIDRADDVRKNLYQKATWIFLAATTVAFFSVEHLLPIDLPMNHTVLAIIFLLTLAYVVLVFLIVKVFFPKRIEYPFGLTRREMGDLVSRHDDSEKNREYNYERWKIAKSNYIDTENDLYRGLILKKYISADTEHQVLNRRIEKDLRISFWLMGGVIVLSIALLFFG